VVLTSFICYVHSYCVVGNSKADMEAAVWRTPAVTDNSQSDDNVANAPALELQTRIDSSQFGDVKR